jgi:predicted RNase H-like HicB family nuclease
MRAARSDRPIRVHVYYSPKAHSYWANSPDLDGLAASGSTRAEVEQEARWAAEALLDLEGWQGPQPELMFEAAVFRAE